ncbi:TetR family transcriptional regulator [Marinactinospora rubrisoli]|uniref:TetR family transcriptional regulator n=1 Tax=Marinactinospora rubrisoli TaxID=2715399 RepID=A0ABW2KKC6_9ACTN
MSKPSFLRARRPEHKEQRRVAILAAAEELAATSGVRRVSLGQVADVVGLAKSNVVRYFGTREEIFLALGAIQWRAWAEDVTDRLAHEADVVAALTEPFADRPLLCDLLGQLSSTVEHNVSLTAAYEFKSTVHAINADVAAAILRARPDLTEKEATDLVGAALTISGALYPIAHPPATIAALYEQHPELAAACPSFLPTLQRVLAALVAGLPTLRD